MFLLHLLLQLFQSLVALFLPLLLPLGESTQPFPSHTKMKVEKYGGKRVTKMTHALSLGSNTTSTLVDLFIFFLCIFFNFSPFIKNCTYKRNGSKKRSIGISRGRLGSVFLLDEFIHHICDILQPGVPHHGRGESEDVVLAGLPGVGDEDSIFCKRGNEGSLVCGLALELDDVEHVEGLLVGLAHANHVGEEVYGAL